VAASPPIPIAAAARQLRLPERSVYRAVEKGRIPSTKSADGVTLVQIEDVAAWRTRRGSQGPSPGATPAVAEPAQSQPPAADVAVTASAAVRQVSGGPSTPLVVGGDLAAAAVAAFDSGATVKQFCQQQRVAPDLALAAWRKVQELEDAGAGGKRDERVHELESELVQLRRDFEFLVQGQDDLAASLAALTFRLNGIPLPPATSCVCNACGSEWTFGKPARCPDCGAHAVIAAPLPEP
jgi:hypothetical protein